MRLKHANRIKIDFPYVHSSKTDISKTIAKAKKKLADASQATLNDAVNKTVSINTARTKREGVKGAQS